jgi:nucleotide-binding universal stress UspA family protein
VKEQGTSRPSFEKILFATDFSKLSLAALPYAQTIAEKHGSRLFVAHVIPFPPPSPRGSWDAMMADAERNENERMSQVALQLGGIPHEVLLQKGSVRLVLT